MAKMMEEVVQPTRLEKVYHEVFGEREVEDCRYYRAELRTPDGKIRHYSLKSSTKKEARKEAQSLFHQMTQVYNDERLIWRMAGDNQWSFGSAQTKSTKPSVWNRFVDYFFALED